ncbi:MAG: choice-of-anchor tandem repeat GloVer-containing protein, partial [Candidatus Korobacteraceae bacterium]
PVFIFQNSSGSDNTNAVFYMNGDGYQDSYNLGTIPAGTYVTVTPGLSNDGGLNHTFFQYTGVPLDTSDEGPNGDDVQFWLIGQQGLQHVTSGVFTPGQTAGPSNDGTVSYLNFLGGPGNADGPCNNCFGPKVVAMLAGVAPNTLHSFADMSDGANPSAGLTMDASGNNLYGTASAGGTGSCTFNGTSGCGTVFKLNHKNDSWILSPLYKFLGGTDGALPLKPVTIGPNGTLYGTTAGGGEGNCDFDGATGCGIVFNATPTPRVPPTPLTPWLEHVLYRFAGEPDGGVPVSDVIFDQAGNMYGTTDKGGANGLGAIFELSPSGGGQWTESVLYSFAGGSDGANPVDGLLFDTAGNLYGTTSNGGGSTACSSGCGTVFELSPSGSGWTERVIYKFQGGNDGKNPNAGLVRDAIGNLYGDTWQGGSQGGGTVFELSPSGDNWSLTTLYSFPGNGFAVDRLTMSSAGNLYGTLQQGGAYGHGAVFELTFTSGNWTYSALYDFTGGGDGGTPLGSVVLDSSGNVYGTTSNGGDMSCGMQGCGVIFQLMP